MPVCHGCHGVMGQGQHQGSAPGKNVCTLGHSPFCRGGVVEDASWKACPSCYVFNPNIQLATESGFESTMVTADFQPRSHGFGPASSTPATTPLSTPQRAQPSQVTGYQAQGATGGERFPSLMAGAATQSQAEGLGSASEASIPQPGIQQVSEEIQSKIDNHRAANQAENLVSNRPNGEENINHLRADPILVDDVEGYLGGARRRIPSLSAAPSAQASDTDNLQAFMAPVSADRRSEKYSYDEAQLSQVASGIRVTAGYNDQGHTTYQQQQLHGVPLLPHLPHQPNGQLQQQQVHVAPKLPDQPLQTNGIPILPHLPPRSTGQLQQQHAQADLRLPDQPLQANGQRQQQVQSGHSVATPYGLSNNLGGQQQQRVQQPGFQVQGPPAQLQQVQQPVFQAPQGLPGQLQQVQLQAPLPGQLQGQQQQIPSAQLGAGSQQQQNRPNQQLVFSGLQQHFPHVQGAQHAQLGGQQQGLQTVVVTQQNRIPAHTTSHVQSVSQLPPHLPGVQHQVHGQPQYQLQSQQNPVTPQTFSPQVPLLTSQHQGLVQNMSQQYHQQSVPDFCYEWLSDATGKKILVRTPLNNPPQPSQSQMPSYQWQQNTGNLAPNQQQQLMVPQQAASSLTTTPVTYKTEFRCCPTTGQQWQVQVPVDTPPAIAAIPAQVRYEWRIHPHTGVSYQVQVPVTSPASYQAPGNSQQLMSPRPASGSVQLQQRVRFSPESSHLGQQTQHTLAQSSDLQQISNQTMSRHERVAGIVSLLEGGGSTKKQSKTLEFAKKCPTKWSKQATMTNINLPLYAWGVTSELEASLSGRSEAMQEGMLLGKLRHLKNTLEVCCLNSSATDFTTYGWTLARDYAAKVEDDVEQKLASWQDMPAGVRTATLVCAQMEHPRPIPNFAPKKYLEKDKKDIKELCTTYNKCTTEGKCEYEVQNPDKTCLRKHECTWCRANKKQSWKHQAWKCKNKDGGK